MKENKMQYKLHDITYTITSATAIASCDNGDENARQNVLIVKADNGTEVSEHIVFGWDMPKTMEDFMEMCADDVAWEAVYDESHVVENIKEKRMSWSEGWHECGSLDYLVEDRKLVRGVMDGKTVYPYVEAKSGGYDNVSGIVANKRNFDKIFWM